MSSETDFEIMSVKIKLSTAIRETVLSIFPKNKTTITTNYSTQEEVTYLISGLGDAALNMHQQHDTVQRHSIQGGCFCCGQLYITLNHSVYKFVSTALPLVLIGFRIYCLFCAHSLEYCLFYCFYPFCCIV